MVGNLVKSLAGHDKDELYVILKEERAYLLLSNGENKSIAHPKKKNKKHVQIIYHKDEAIAARLIAGELVREEEIKRFIKLYKMCE